MKRDIEKYEQARKLRQEGKSIRFISKTLKISSSSASIWSRDVELSNQQKINLASKGKSVKLLRSYARKRHEDKIINNKLLFDQSKDMVEKLRPDSLFLIGVALYWAEGFKSKKEPQVGFCNSDPKMVRFIIKWFEKSLKILREDFILRAEFNITHSVRKDEIEDYWSDLTGIPKSQFNKPYLQKVKKSRDYSNQGKYYGLLRIRVRKSSQLLVKLRGWIEGLSKAA